MRPIPVALSTASVYPEPAEAAFEMAARLGYDGIELMVWADRASQTPDSVRRLSRRYRLPVLAVHAPCLLITQRVWSSDPEMRLQRSVRMAEKLGAPTVVVHPPFRWQRNYAASFEELVGKLEARSGIAIAVENMFPVKPLGNRTDLSVSGFRPSPDPTDVGFQHYTLDLSHTAAARQDAVAMTGRMGTGLSHLHLADGFGVPRDQHLPPGEGNQPCEQVCHQLAEQGFAGTAVLEISTRKAATRQQRIELLDQSLTFARTHLDRPTPPVG